MIETMYFALIAIGFVFFFMSLHERSVGLFPAISTITFFAAAMQSIRVEKVFCFANQNITANNTILCHSNITTSYSMMYWLLLFGFISLVLTFGSVWGDKAWKF